MNILKDSLFSSSNKRKLTRPTQNRFRNYGFRQANNSLIDPLLYTFENADIELDTMESDEESKSNDEHNVRTRYSRQSCLTPSAHDGGSIVIVEKPVLPNETIQAFAIRYRVHVSQLRRINNLQNDQEFYALTYCRVPVSRFGLLHEYSESSSTLVDLHEQSRISLPVTHLSQQNHLAFLNAMDQDLALMRTKVEQLIEGSSTTTAAAAVVPSSLDSSGVKTSTSALNCDETDYGCKSWHIIVIIIVIALIPIICAYFYIKSLHSK
ncbi:unnamed protein product [Rotaria socialis]|uniref:LysM domain-containing protein n=1 Tax=Rotaria socialis TaxID=392032 RepID=A0A818RB28_9BILA|nr:unnamed protein product [Rotaria socialis]CAF4760518.1 unnamed protein product [Rotaria socialis]